VPPVLRSAPDLAMSQPSSSSMDPPHLAEFASQRYFNKLKQLHEAKDQPQTQDGVAIAQSSTFILPIGKPRPDQSSQLVGDVAKAAEKRRGHFFRTILPSRASVDQDHRRLSTEVPKKKRYYQNLSPAPSHMGLA
jgi:hypothetical protein